MDKLSNFVLILVIGLALAQNLNEIDGDDLKEKLGEQFPELKNFNQSLLPKPEDVEKKFKEKCEQNGADPSIVDNWKENHESLKSCMEKYVNVTILQEELEEAKKTGAMDEVFGRYCGKYGDIHQCFADVTGDVRKCLNHKEAGAFNITLTAIGELKEFLCYKDGDRMAMFVAEGGPECIEEQKNGIQNCMNATLGTRIPTDLSIENMPSFLFTDNDCSDFDTIRTCINVELEKCKTNTPANLMDAFFKFLKKHTPCKNVPTNKMKAALKDSATTGAVSTFAVLVSFIVVRLF
ncbi:unnamed protein product [Brassicogethes aeneus]|uniref:Uncharacterized protein n=1 Tax=Brassicogethes aeneus TaxID=1431903 RepID=A0A9P0FIP6_BRAAE|nr:unnamed protein product [Brassicogethes aeneus]